MKRFLMVIALCLFTHLAKAQVVNLEALILRLADGQIIGPGQYLDTNRVLCALAYYGPDAVGQGDYALLRTSADKIVGGVVVPSAIFFPEEITVAGSGIIYRTPNAEKKGAGHIAPYNLSSDSIRALLDWDQWNTNNTIVPVSPPYVNGKSYGYFFQALYLVDINGNPISTDPVPGNNIAVERIVWTNNVGIGELFAKKEKKNLSVYPVPATSGLNFEFKFDKPSHAQAQVRDMAGRVVIGRNFGRALPGIQQYSLDIASLPNGIYTIEFNTDEEIASAKFTIAR